MYACPIDMEDRATGRISTCRGYFAKFGISISSNKSPQGALNRIVTDRAICWEDTNIDVVDWDVLDDEIKRQSQGFGSRALWYTGPRFLFP